MFVLALSSLLNENSASSQQTLRPRNEGQETSEFKHQLRPYLSLLSNN